MKSLTIFIALTFSVMFSSSLYAKWTEATKNPLGTFYVDFERIRKHDGYIYWWSLWDFVKPLSRGGELSGKTYQQGDCKLFRLKRLSYIRHKQPMGRDTGDTVNEPDAEWTYPSPNSVDETILKSVCNR
jgi:hypothetical protein